MDGRPDYEILAEIGEGSYGQVFKARETGQQQRLVAVKKMKLPAEQRASGDAGIPAFMVREVALLRRLEAFRHPNIIRMLDVSVCVRDQALDMTVVFEYIDQDLAAFLHSASQTGLSRDKIRDVTRQLLSGLDFLHSNMVVHRDLKPDNVLISSRGVVKITDLGLARIYTYNIALTPTVVTLWYRAPEVLLRSIYMSSVDIWSAGCIFAELYLLSKRPGWLGHVTRPLTSASQKFLEFSPAKRITASQALRGDCVVFTAPRLKAKLGVLVPYRRFMNRNRSNGHEVQPRAVTVALFISQSGCF
uniref:Protein kinase domain-containing protein n=1 Tax=Denticeps clupeoides TaxID=299321 RepID=A0AAY4CKC7_9TELE